jgi:uncharacterized membrane protein YhiD involved in acid resistance
MYNFIVPGVAFAVVSSPATYQLTRKVAGSWIASADGAATPAGLFLHTLVFLFVLFLLGRFLPRMSGYGIDNILKKQQDPMKKNEQEMMMKKKQEMIKRMR